MTAKKLKIKNIYLMGIMGCGKSTIGKYLAERLDLPFIDTDDVIVRQNNMSISELFAKYGETTFRSIEKNVIQDVSGLSGHVVALGGGAILDPQNWDCIVSSGTTITLSYPPEIIEKRSRKKNQRPLLNQKCSEERLRRIVDLLQIRNPIYQKADLVIHLNEELPKNAVAAILETYLGAVS
jgi:shikimate kinase